MRIGGHEIDITNRDKIFFPDDGLTKGDMIDYYEKVAGVMLAHTKRYGVSMQRFPDGIEEGGFFNKDAPDYFPSWLNRVNMPKREGGSYDAPVIDTRAALVYLADQAVLTPHLYLSRFDDLERPDKIIFDLDPPSESEDFAAVRKAALDIRTLMEELDLEAWVQTTGSKGFHVVVPLRPDPDFDEVRRFAYDAALVLVRRHSNRYTLEQRKDQRRGRIFLDTLRNAYGATSVAPYAIRARPGAPVATPLEWHEIERGASPRDWTMETIPKRLAQKKDPWSNLMRHARSLPPRRERLAALLQEETPVDQKD